MTASANDAAVVLAEHVSGSVEKFSILMNEKAKALGCENTNFVNPNGEHNENHYSTAYELALISKEGMKNSTFRRLVSTLSYKLAPTNKVKKERVFETTNSLLIENPYSSPDNYYYRYANRS
jgi:D-alanyl-D-alanine carboxypeptidase